MNDRWIKTQNLFQLLDPEPFLILCSLFLLAYVFYKLFLGDVSDERHRNLRGHFKNITRHFLAFASGFTFFLFLRQFETPFADKIIPYLGVFSLVWGMIVFVKTCRLIILQYLFLGSMRAGVPVLIVNIFSLILSIVMALWTANQIFGIEVGPLLATSAAFSVVLGLAMQDTLGNLFAGVSLQVDKNFDIGDWLEVVNGLQKTVGQVNEISWRATTLIGLSDEKITIPNRTLANSQIFNFSDGEQPIVRHQLFRLPYGTNTAEVKQLLTESIKSVQSVRKFPEPFAYLADSTENWIAFKLVYFIDNYGAQFNIGAEVTEMALSALEKKGHPLAMARIEMSKAREI